MGFSLWRWVPAASAVAQPPDARTRTKIFGLARSPRAKEVGLPGARDSTPRFKNSRKAKCGNASYLVALHTAGRPVLFAAVNCTQFDLNSKSTFFGTPPSLLSDSSGCPARGMGPVMSLSSPPLEVRSSRWSDRPATGGCFTPSLTESPPRSTLRRESSPPARRAITTPQAELPASRREQMPDVPHARPDLAATRPFEGVTALNSEDVVRTVLERTGTQPNC